MTQRVNRAVQRANSRKSCYRGLPSSRDEGQRYVVQYRDGVGDLRIYGYTDDLDEARRLKAEVSVKSVMFSHFRIVDRGARA